MSHLFILDPANAQVLEVNTMSGATVAALPITTANVSAQMGVTVDAQGVVYVSDPGNTQVVKVTSIALTTAAPPVPVLSVSSASSSSTLPAIQSSTASGRAYSDPYFAGFWQQVFYLHGRDGEVYSILSDELVQLNARLTFLTNITCPSSDQDTAPSAETARVHCSDHAGTYFGEMALTALISSSLATVDSPDALSTLYIHAGPVDSGFTTVTVNDAPLSVNDTYDAPSASALSSRSSLSVHRSSARSLTVHVGLYELLIENSDRYMDLVEVRITNWTALLQTVQPEGVLGCTWNRTTPIPPEEATHRELNANLTGINTRSNKFAFGTGIGITTRQPDTLQRERKQERTHNTAKSV